MNMVPCGRGSMHRLPFSASSALLSAFNGLRSVNREGAADSVLALCISVSVSLSFTFEAVQRQGRQVTAAWSSAQATDTLPTCSLVALCFCFRCTLLFVCSWVLFVSSVLCQPAFAASAVLCLVSVVGCASAGSRFGVSRFAGGAVAHSRYGSALRLRVLLSAVSCNAPARKHACRGFTSHHTSYGFWKWWLAVILLHRAM